MKTLKSYNYIKQIQIICLGLLFILLYVKTSSAQGKWPVLKTYKGEFLKQIDMPIGGIGTGTISLTGNGALHDWAIMSTPAKGFNAMIPQGPPVNRAAFFAIYIKEEGRKGKAVLCEGPVSDRYYEGDRGSTRKRCFSRSVSRTSNGSYS